MQLAVRLFSTMQRLHKGSLFAKVKCGMLLSVAGGNNNPPTPPSGSNAKSTQSNDDNDEEDEEDGAMKFSCSILLNLCLILPLIL